MQRAEKRHRKAATRWLWQINNLEHMVRITMFLYCDLYLASACFSTVIWWIIQKNSWHNSTFFLKKVWCGLDLPGFSPTHTVGSIVPLNETSWLSTVWAHVAAIDGWHAISPTRCSADHHTAVEITEKTAALPHRPDQGPELYAPSAIGQSSLPPAHLPPHSTSPLLTRIPVVSLSFFFFPLLLFLTAVKFVCW